MLSGIEIFKVFVSDHRKGELLRCSFSEPIYSVSVRKMKTGIIKLRMLCWRNATETILKFSMFMLIQSLLRFVLFELYYFGESEPEFRTVWGCGNKCK